MLFDKRRRCKYVPAIPDKGSRLSQEIDAPNVFSEQHEQVPDDLFRLLAERVIDIYDQIVCGDTGDRGDVVVYRRVDNTTQVDKLHLDARTGGPIKAVLTRLRRSLFETVRLAANPRRDNRATTRTRSRYQGSNLLR